MALHVGPGSASFIKLKKTELLFYGLKKNKYIVFKAIPETEQVSNNVSDSTLPLSLLLSHTPVFGISGVNMLLANVFIGWSSLWPSVQFSQLIK